MARPQHEGTSRDARSKGYVFPPRKRTLLWTSIAIGVLAVVVLIGSYFAQPLLPVGGFRRTLSPGDVASHHARIDLKCAQCHEPGNEVVALRCERCHDPSGSERLTHAAHVLLGSGDTRKAEAAEQTNCATCHTEHRGLMASLRSVDDRECATCHTFSTLASHPEFAAVRAQATAGVGLKFNHDRHLIEAQNTRGATCQICHVQTADRTGFVPMSFDQHCASCHAPEGTFTESDPILGELVVPPESLPATWSSRTAVRLQQRGRKLVASGLRHRDGWVMFNALRIRQGVDPDGEAAERLSLRGRIAYLQQLLDVRPVHQSAPEELQTSAAALQAEIADLDAALGAQASNDSDAFREIVSVTQALAKQLAAADPTAAADVQSIAQASLDVATSPAAMSDTDAQARFERRKGELLKLVDTVAGRTADDALRQRAAALKAEIEKLAPSAASTSADTDALLTRLSTLDDVLATVKTIPDPGVQSQVAQIDVLRGYGQQRVALGLSAADFETRKSELLGLLDAVERRGGAAVRLRVAPLRQRIIALRPGSTGTVELSRSRRQLQKQLDRVRLEMELVRSTADYEPAPAQDARVDPVQLQQTLQILRAQLTDLERAPRMSASQSPEDREQRRNELDALLSRCLKCHEYDPSGVRLSAVRVAEPVMQRSIFNHAPHTTQTACETCHGSTRTSKLATDVNVPGVANCTTCHTPSQARSECETCHVYHPSSPARLLAVTR